MPYTNTGDQISESEQGKITGRMKSSGVRFHYIGESTHCLQT